MSNAKMLKKTYKPKGSIEPFYTGGTAVIDANANHLISPVQESIHVIRLDTGETIHKLEGNSDAITCVALQPNGQKIVSASRSNLLKIWDFETGNELNSWKAHEAPVFSMSIDPSSTYLATGSADATIKVWDVEGLFCTHNFKGGHGAPISVVRFHAEVGKMLLFTGDESGLVLVWDLITRKCVASLTSHVSRITSIDFSPDTKYLLTAGRDKVFNVWDLSDYSLIMTVPTYEFLEAVGFIKSEQVKDLVYTGGEKGMVKIWNWKTGEMLHSVHIDEQAKKNSIYDILYSESEETCIVITTDQNFIFYDLSSPQTPVRKRQLIGYNEEILDFSFLDKEANHLAVATNSEQIRIYNLETKDCKILYGHENIVFCVDSYQNKDPAKDILVSGSKDKQARIWKKLPTAGDSFVEDPEYQCIGVCVGHNEPVSAVVLGKKTGTMMLTASSDRTIKYWDLNQLVTSEQEQKLKSIYTFQAHDKDINSLDIAKNEKIFASGSQDKTAKVWSMADGKLLGICKGHKRGVWQVLFSTYDQVLATCSADKTIKIWNLSDFTCLKTFEGHLNSVLQLSFVSAGMQLLSSGADGLVKLWTIRTNECVSTFDEHEDRVWALTTDEEDKYMVTGGGDSKIVIWQDVTEQEELEIKQQDETRVLEEQQLSNYVAKKDFRNAIKLALKLDRPFHLLKLIETIIQNSDVDSIDTIQDMIRSIMSNPQQLTKLFMFMRDWNTSSRKSYYAQYVLNIVLKTVDSEKILGLTGVKDILEGILAYTDRHYAKSKGMAINNYVVDFSLI